MTNKSCFGLEKGNEIKDITKEQLDAETQSVIKQQEMQSRLDSISNRFSAIGTNLVTHLHHLWKQ